MLTRSFQLVLVAVLFASPGFAQANTRPDFSGVWTTYRAPGAGGGQRRQRRRQLRQNCLTPRRRSARSTEYQALVQPTGDTPGGYCLGTGMPGSMLGSGGYPMEIIQRPDQITIVYEAHNEIRRVYFGNRILPVADRFRNETVTPPAVGKATHSSLKRRNSLRS